MKRVKRFGVYQTSKVVAIILFIASLIFLIPFGLIVGLTFGNHFSGFPFGGGIFMIILPILYGVFGFITTAIGCLVYNLVAKWTGGIELEFEVVEEDAEPVN
jgi:glycopeptide antibiotics resistance protein